MTDRYFPQPGDPLSRPTATVQTAGSIPAIVRNTFGVYDGSLAHYWQALFMYAKNLENPYHNLGHIGNVLFLCHEAIVYYTGLSLQIDGREARNLLIAAIFHDFDHTGRAGDDWVNIKLAIEGLRRHILPEDAAHFDRIAEYITATKFPYETVAETLPLPAQILRDADKCQALSVSWLQQVVIGFSKEWNKPRLDVLIAQIKFHEDIAFSTDWAKERYPREAILAKIAEAQEHIDLLTMPAPTAETVVV